MQRLASSKRYNPAYVRRLYQRVVGMPALVTRVPVEDESSVIQTLYLQQYPRMGIDALGFPERLNAGETFVVTVYYTNMTAFDGEMWFAIIDADTGVELVHWTDATFPVAASEVGSHDSPVLTMPSKDLNFYVTIGHVEYVSGR